MMYSCCSYQSCDCCNSVNHETYYQLIRISLVNLHIYPYQDQEHCQAKTHLKNLPGITSPQLGERIIENNI